MDREVKPTKVYNQEGRYRCLESCPSNSMSLLGGCIIEGSVLNGRTRDGFKLCPLGYDIVVEEIQ